MTYKGVDVSHWEGRINWEVAAQYVQFAILKCTEAATYTDPTYSVNKQGCIDNGISHGAYHFFRTNVDPIAQAQLFYDKVGPDMKFLCADVETVDGGDLKLNLRKFMDKLESLAGVTPYIYTSPGFWNAYGIQDPIWCQHFGLWVAHWTAGLAPLLPHEWSSWVVWQYTDRGSIPGIITYVDMNNMEKEPIDVFQNGKKPVDKLSILWREAGLHGWNLEP